MKYDCERCGKPAERAMLCVTHRGETERYHDYTPGRLCRECHIDLLPDPEVVYPQLLESDFTFYYGAASGSAQKALRKMEVEPVMVSYRTKNNGRIGPENEHFVDCGGAPDSFLDGALAKTGDYVTSDDTYLDYIIDVNATYWSLRDYPCEPGVLDQHDRTVADHQEMTIDRHRSLLEKASVRSISGQPVSILQGWTVDDYLHHLDMHRDAGTLTDYVGIGSVCRRHAVDEITTIIRRIREALPVRHELHAFGVKLPVLESPGMLNALTSADSTAYDYGLMMESIYGDTKYNWQTVLHEFLEFKSDIGKLIANYESQSNQRMLTQYSSDRKDLRLASLHNSSDDC